MSKPAVGFSTMIYYGFGRAAEAVKSRVFETFLFFYYVQVMEVSGTYAGLAVGAALAFDAVTDPLMGSYSDRYSSRWGRRHPFMFFSAFPLTVTFLMLMIPPDGLSELQLACWLALFSILVRASVTLFHVPHLSLAPELVTHYDKRTSLVLVRNVMGILGSAAAFFIGFNYFFAATEEFANGQLNADAYPGYAIAMATLMLVSIMVCVFGTKKHIPYLKLPVETRSFQFSDIYRDVILSLQNRSFRTIFLGMLSFSVYSGVHATMNLHMGTYFWELSPREFTLYALAVLAGALLGLPLAWLSIRLFDKKMSYLVLIGASAVFITTPVVLRLVDMFPGNDHPLFLVTYYSMTLVGIAAALAAGTSAASMVMDTTDEHELDTGHRQEGAFYGAISFSGKAASAFGHLIGGVVIDLIRFPLGSDVTPGTVDADIIWNMGFFFGPVVALMPVITIWLVSSYSIDRARHGTILAGISDNKRG